MAEKDQAPTAATPNPEPQAPAPTASAPLGTMVAPADGQPAAPQPGPNDPIPEADLALLNRAPKLRWGVIGCGVIANEMAASLALEGRRIAGVANRTRAKAEAYAARHGVEKVYDSYQQMYDDPDIDAIYVTTPHNTHIDFIRDADNNTEFATYQGYRVIVDDSMTVVGTGPSRKFISIIFGNGAIGYGEGSPSNPLEYEREASRGNGGGVETLWTRKTWLLHPFGYSFTSAVITGNGTETIARSASWQDLANASNWNRVVERKHVPIAFLVTGVGA